MIHAFLKRILDITGASLGLLAVLPLFPLIIAAIMWESPGPVLVKLNRVSKGRVVKVYKFRSMVHGAHAMKPSLAHMNERRDGPFFKIKNDPRLTRTGKLLRKFRLDEFPQLANVLTGELALVGPRPHEPEEVIHYPGRYQHLLLAKAGVTGLSQVNGASSLPFLKELELDSHYVKHPSLATDVKIIGKTIGIIFSDPTAV
ncbi:MAG: sugar transferase [bacterium]|nr:sugar transferase [bacterium]